VAWRIDVGGDETAALAELVDLRGRRILEVGAGDGRLTRLIAREAASVLGIDPDAERIAQARADLPAELAESVRLEVADVVELDVPEERYDLALLSWSL
jgi:ubiquinone/menaquinone biosynthesis C-methylase UbiE